MLQFAQQLLEIALEDDSPFYECSSSPFECFIRVFQYNLTVLLESIDLYTSLQEIPTLTQN